MRSLRVYLRGHPLWKYIGHPRVTIAIAMSCWPALVRACYLSTIVAAFLGPRVEARPVLLPQRPSSPHELYSLYIVRVVSAQPGRFPFTSAGFFPASAEWYLPGRSASQPACV